MNFPLAVAVGSLLLALTSCESTHMDGGHNWKEGRQHLSVFTGLTSEDNESAATIGLDYEYRVDQHLGLGAVVEQATEDVDATTILAVADLHITNYWVVQTGPGIEFLEHEDEFVYRIGTLYEWEYEGYTISPQVHYDMTGNENALIVGFAVGVGF